MTPEEKKAASVDRYKRVYAVIYQLERYLNAGMAGDSAARALDEFFDQIPHPLRGTLAHEGAGPAMFRLQKAEGPIADAVDRMFKRCKEDPNYKRRLQAFWECIGDSQTSGVEDGEDSDHTPGEVDDENSVPVRRGAVRAPAPDDEGGHKSEAPGEEHAGGVKGEFVYPNQGEETPEIDPASPVAEIDDEPAGQYGEDGEGDDGSGV